MKAIALFRYKVSILFLVAVVAAAIVTPVIFWAIAALGLASVAGAIAVGLVVDLGLMLAVTFLGYKGLKKALLNEAKAFFKRAHVYYYVEHPDEKEEVDQKAFKNCLEHLTVSESKDKLAFIAKTKGGVSLSLAPLFKGSVYLSKLHLAQVPLYPGLKKEDRKEYPETSVLDDLDSNVEKVGKYEWESLLEFCDDFFSKDSQKNVNKEAEPSKNSTRSITASYEFKGNHKVTYSDLTNKEKVKPENRLIRLLKKCTTGI